MTEPLPAGDPVRVHGNVGLRSFRTKPIRFGTDRFCTRKFCREFNRAYDVVFCAKRPWLRTAPGGDWS